MFFSRAGGGRFEACILLILTAVLFFTFPLVIPYIPTTLASLRVLFVGIELVTFAMWDSANELCLLEWIVVMGTMVACTLLGFAPGFGIGIVLALVLHCVWGFVDSVSVLLKPTSGRS